MVRVLKLLACLFACMLTFASYSTEAKPEDYGVVDLNKVIDNYTKAQEVSAELRVKESELQKFLVDAQKKVKDSKTPLEKKNLEEKLGEEFNIKRGAFIKEQSEKWENIENEIFKTIEEIQKRKKFDLVFNKQGIILGGNDITEEIISELNKGAKK